MCVQYIERPVSNAILDHLGRCLRWRAQVRSRLRCLRRSRRRPWRRGGSRHRGRRSPPAYCTGTGWHARSRPRPCHVGLSEPGLVPERPQIFPDRHALNLRMPRKALRDLGYTVWRVGQVHVRLAEGPPGGLRASAAGRRVGARGGLGPSTPRPAGARSRHPRWSRDTSPADIGSLPVGAPGH